MRKAVAIYGASDEALALIRILEENPEIEIAGVFAANTEEARQRAAARNVQVEIHSDPALFDRPLHAIVEDGSEPPLAEALPEASTRAQIVTPLTARLLWGYGASTADRKSELLQALHEIVSSVELTVDTDELFARMLEIAMGVTGADGGSLMLLDTASQELTLRVAVGIEPELWSKVRVRMGDGIAGRAAAEARAIKVRGRADGSQYRLMRDRPDVASALSVPLVHEGRVLGVLNLHHGDRPDNFDDDDLEFAEQLGRLDAEIILRAQEHETLRRQASRYAAVQAVREALRGDGPLEPRLEQLCGRVAGLVGGGIATIHLLDPEGASLRMVATSLQGGGFGADYRQDLGQGIDGRAAATREPVFLDTGGQLAVAALPLLAGSQLVGVLSTQAGPGAGGGRGLRETLLEVAAAAAEEIAQARREARMSARATKMSAINEAGIRLISTRDISEVSRLATSTGALILEADHAVLRLQEPESRRFVIRSYYGSADGRTQEGLFRLDKEISVRTLKARQPRLVPDLSVDPAGAEVQAGFRSVLAAPLKREGRVVGTLALYDKVAADSFFAASFADDDLQIFAKYVSYVERALENAFYYASTQEHRNFDEETGLPNADYLARRIDQELARAGGRENSLALVSCRLETLEEIRREDPRRADRLVQSAADALRANLRDFDVVARSGDDEFLVLLPDPGPAPDERITALARAVAESLAHNERLEGTTRAGLAYGYAVHPEDGTDREALLRRTMPPRIRMV
jgi:diguanylate cyclase (GGDEF)-like protein